jgi:hypothetical protein
MIFFNLIIAWVGWKFLLRRHRGGKSVKMPSLSACMCHIRGVISAEESRKIASSLLVLQCDSRRGINSGLGSATGLFFHPAAPSKDAPPAPPNVIFRVAFFNTHTDTNELLFCFVMVMACVALFPPATNSNRSAADSCMRKIDSALVWHN